MAINFKSSACFVLIVSFTVCAKVKIDAKKHTGTNDDDFFTQFEISYDEEADSKNVASYKVPYSKHCLGKSEKFSLKIDKFFQKDEKVKVQFALNSGRYDETSDFDIDVAADNCEIVCILWGSWMPANNKKDKESEIFFNILTDRTQIMTGYLFFIDAQLEKVKNLNILLKLQKLGPKADSDKNLFSSSPVLISRTACSKDAYENEVVYLDNKDFTRKGEGSFSLPRIVAKSELLEVETTINMFEKTIVGRRMMLVSMNLSTMDCTDTGFKVAEYVNKIGGPIKELI
mgnify:CR=1 FL=1